MKTRNLSIDALKIILAFLVVGLHLDFLKDVDSTAAYVFKNGIARIVVPTFLIISGFYFASVTTKEAFKKWCLRLFLLYIIWMLIYAPFWFPVGLSLIQSIKAIIFTLLFGYHHLWYLIGAFISFVILWYIRPLKLNYQLLIVALFGLLGVFLQYNKYYHFLSLGTTLVTDPPITLYRSPILFCLPFAYLGYIINKKQLYKMNLNWVVLCIGSLMLVILESFLNYQNTSGNKFDMLLTLYIACPLLFIAVYNFQYLGTSKAIAMYSTGIYLTHILVYELLKKTIAVTLFSESIIVLITILISVFLTYLIITIKEKFNFRYIL